MKCVHLGTHKSQLLRPCEFCFNSIKEFFNYDLNYSTIPYHTSFYYECPKSTAVAVGYTSELNWG